MNPRRSRISALSLAALAALVAGVAPGAGVAATTKRVVIKDIDFTPATVTISRGSKVTWLWRDDNVPHNVASRGTKRFRSAGTKNTGSYTVTFKKAGTYRYVCTIHANMRAKVVVR